MPHTSFSLFIFNFLLANILLGTNAYAADQSSEVVQIQFTAKISEEDFKCGKSYTMVGRPHQTITPTDWRMFISDVHLRDPLGVWIPLQLIPDGMWQNSQLTLLDFENGKGPCRNGTSGLNLIAKGRIPLSTYNGIKFKVGLPFHQNHGDPTTANPPLSTTAMFWNWQGGYKFIKFDAWTATSDNSRSSPQRSAFAFHLGSTQCASDAQTQPPIKACQKPNVVQVELIGEDPVSTPVVFDMATLLRNTDVANNAPNTPPGCMSSSSDPDCTEIFRHLNLLVPTSEVLTPGFVRWSK